MSTTVVLIGDIFTSLKFFIVFPTYEVDMKWKNNPTKQYGPFFT